MPTNQSVADGIIVNSPEVVSLRDAFEGMGIRFRVNLFKRKQLEICKDDKGWQDVQDEDYHMVHNLRDAVLPKCKIDVGRLVFDMAWATRVNPLTDYLDSLKWDGTPRIDTWLMKYLGVKDTPLDRAIGRMFLIGAVKRAYNPGCKFDYCLTLQGPERKGKSQVCAALVPNPKWFTDSMVLGADAKVTVEQTEGIWIAELAELVGNAEYKQEQIKSFLSRTTDGPFRPAYGRASIHVPRQFVMIATTNSPIPLKSDEGNRRFWITTIVSGDAYQLELDRDQLWAEAVEAYKAHTGEIKLNTDLHLEMQERQKFNQLTDGWVQVIERHVKDLPFGEPITFDTIVSTVLHISPRDRTKHTVQRVTSAMSILGFKRERKQVDGVTTWVFKRNNPHNPFLPENFDTDPEAERAAKKMDEWLIEQGVPEEHVYGYEDLDSDTYGDDY